MRRENAQTLLKVFLEAIEVLRSSTPFHFAQNDVFSAAVSLPRKRLRLAPAEGSYASQKETAVRSTSPPLRMTEFQKRK
jgi:hypothetical protein